MYLYDKIGRITAKILYSGKFYKGGFKFYPFDFNKLIERSKID